MLSAPCFSVFLSLSAKFRILSKVLFKTRWEYLGKVIHYKSFFLTVLYRIGRADKIVTDSVHVLCDQPYLKQQSCESLGLIRYSVVSQEKIVKNQAQFLACKDIVLYFGCNNRNQVLHLCRFSDKFPFEKDSAGVETSGHYSNVYSVLEYEFL